MSTTGRSTIVRNTTGSITGVIPTRKSVQERDRACRALLEEAERLENAFHEGWLKTNGGFDRERERGEPSVPLKAFQYVARIARAGLENDTALAFLGPVRPAVVASLAALERFLWHDFLLEEYDVEPLQQRLLFFLGLLADAMPPGEDEFPVETTGEIGPAPRLESRGRILVGTRRFGCESPEKLRLGDWPLFPGRVPSHPVTLAMIRWRSRWVSWRRAA